MTVSQENRLVRIDTPLGDDVVLVQSLTSSEAVSNLFSVHLDLLSERASLSLESLVGQGVTVALELPGEGHRFFHGIVSRFGTSGTSERFSLYYAELVPWLWLLTRKVDCRVFQDLTVPEIIMQVFDRLKADFSALVNYRDALTGRYTKLDYCVQYRETDFSFVSRLMEQEGIFYFFEHERGKHTLVLGDSPQAHGVCPNQARARYEPAGGTGEGEDTIVGWQVERQLRPGRCTLRDFHFQMPGKSLEVSEPTTMEVGGNTRLEVYDYPGEYAQRFVQPEQRLDRVEPEGRAIVQLRMQEEEAAHMSVTGTSYCRAFVPGTRFELTHHSDGVNGQYMLVAVQHSVTQSPDYFSDAATAEPYQNQFTCVPLSVPYRPARITPKPNVQGPQTAVVVGKAGEEIWTDKYGRVKVQFPWDRAGHFNENSSCWVRVSQPWAGKGWGAIAIPRIGQEVIVDFLEGDPDQPIITGRVYNAEQMPPYDLPANQTQSGVKSRSSKQGTPANFNEIRFEDAKGQELFSMHAERNLSTVVEADETHSVGHDRSTTIGNDENISVDRHRTEHVHNGHETIVIHTGNRTVDVNTGHDTLNVKTGNHEVNVNTGHSTLNVRTGNRDVNVPAGAYQLKANRVVITAMADLTLQCGPGKININAAGIITIQGPMVKINC